jgi:hypothetical protein
MTQECNKSFSELVRFHAVDEKRKFFETQNTLQLMVAAAFSAAPLLGPASPYLDDVAREFINQIWGSIGVGFNTSVDAAANGITPGSAGANVTGAFTEASLGVYLARTFAQRIATQFAAAEAATLIAAAAPVIAEIAAVVLAFIAATAVALVTKIVVQATADYLAQGDNPSIFNIATDGNINEGVVFSNLTSAIHDDGVTVRNSGIYAQMFGLSSGAPLEVLTHCPDVLQLTGFGDTLDVSEVNLDTYELR